MKKHTLLLCLILFLLQSGCAKSQPVPTSIILTPRLYPVTPTGFVATQVPTALPTQTIKIIQSPNPTLTFGEQRDMLLSILTSHDDCRLPCIMGFDPSEKEKYRWNQFFVPIRAVEDHEGFWVYKSNYKTTDIIDMIILNDINLTFIYVSRHWGKNPLSYTLYGEIQHQIGTGVTMQSSPAIGELVNNPYLKQYHPSKILSGYGSPDQILLYNSPFIDDSMHSREYGMGLILIYEKQNFMVAYSFPRRLVNDQYIGCPQNAIYIYISTWAPDVNPTPVQMLDDFSGGYINPDFIDLYKPIEQVTLWNVEEFTTIFGDEKLEMCITTPMEPWALEPIN